MQMRRARHRGFNALRDGSHFFVTENAAVSDRRHACRNFQFPNLLGMGLPGFLKRDINQTLALFWALFGIALQGSISYWPCLGPHYNCYYATTTITDLIVYIYHYYHYK